MLIYYKHKKGKGNFGDELSPFIVNNLLKFYNIKLTTRLLAIGSIFYLAKDNDYVWGTGIRDLNHLPKCQHLKITLVRGPLTLHYLKSLDLVKDNVIDIGDPALLLTMFYVPTIKPKFKHKYALIPHYTHYNYYKTSKLHDKFVLINPLWHWKRIVNIINSCKAVISSSLHGIIVADSYKKPNIWLKEFILEEGDFKFTDYYKSQQRPIIFIKSLNLSEINTILMYKITNGSHINKNNLLNSFKRLFIKET
jgi:pyruvyltransferase